MAGSAVCFMALVIFSNLQPSFCETAVEKCSRRRALIPVTEVKADGILRHLDPPNSHKNAGFGRPLLAKSDNHLSSSFTSIIPRPGFSSDSLSFSSAFSFTSSSFSSSSFASSRMLLSRRLHPILEKQQDFPGDDPSLGRLLVDVIRREMRGCSLVLAANGGFEASLALQEVLRLPNFRQVGLGRGCFNQT